MPAEDVVPEAIKQIAAEQAERLTPLEAAHVRGWREAAAAAPAGGGAAATRRRRCRRRRRSPLAPCSAARRARRPLCAGAPAVSLLGAHRLPGPAPARDSLPPSLARPPL